MDRKSGKKSSSKRKLFSKKENNDQTMRDNGMSITVTILGLVLIGLVIYLFFEHRNTVIIGSKGKEGFGNCHRRKEGFGNCHRRKEGFACGGAHDRKNREGFACGGAHDRKNREGFLSRRRGRRRGMGREGFNNNFNLSNIRNIMSKIRNVENFTNNDRKIVCVLASWCGHCKTFKKDVLAPLRDQHPNIPIEVYEDDKDAEKRFNVSGFPTIILVLNGQDDPIPLNEPRTVEGLVNFYKNN